MTELRISIRNSSDLGGTAVTPFFFGFHDNSFDLYDLGAASSAGLEALAEDGNTAPLAAELTSADADAQTVNVVGSRGPIGTGELASTQFTVNGTSNGYASFAAMVLPSNDAFVGTANAVKLFNADGSFVGAQTVSFDGGSVRDAGTEVNTEEDAAFLNQTAPNTGVTEGGVVTIHPGFNGSAGNPGGTQNILGGTNAFGDLIDPAAADFTLSGNDIAVVHINTVKTTNGTSGRDFFYGRSDDDIVNAGDGRDFVYGGKGWDVINGEGGNDKLFGGRGDDIVDGGSGRDWISGGSGNDDLNGGEGRDYVFGGRGNDNIFGGDDNDFISGGSGNDIISGGDGKDVVSGGRGNDIFVFSSGDDRDIVKGFDKRGDDRIALSVEGVETFDDVVENAYQFRGGVYVDFGEGDSLFFKGVHLSSLGEEDFLFG